MSLSANFQLMISPTPKLISAIPIVFICFTSLRKAFFQATKSPNVTIIDDFYYQKHLLYDIFQIQILSVPESSALSDSFCNQISNNY